ncbi:MAG: hemolysin III family protein [Aeromicrobium sp.]|uniref:PAQR family membrane homeostasis protein TrhA n=1 Tax=Aeromicrobium sp. TaxID=1871063 RepID=UPI0025BED99D|nr:hemolysin III family protein [Aeromicrobium sp.]MCK5890130.1 hemolysin III family protein [Aeromicrobium sp.]MDF1703825.1 hemolysin III family protein [Aeromicrobium sp.]
MPETSSITDEPVLGRFPSSLEEIKPRLRGWLHAAVAPLAFVSFLVMMVIADDVVVRAGAAVFMVSALLLFSCSAIYHTRTWNEEARIVWKRIDHANIFLLIAGSYTPFSLLLLSTEHAIIMLSIVWGGALLGVAFRVFWVGAPRWIYVPLYVALGWAAVLYWNEFVDAAPTAVIVLMVVGGGLYTLGAVVYGFKWPNPWPRWFGFHEVFHTLTIAAFVVHYVGISLLAYNQR